VDKLELLNFALLVVLVQALFLVKVVEFHFNTVVLLMNMNKNVLLGQKLFDKFFDRFPIALFLSDFFKELLYIESEPRYALVKGAWIFFFDIFEQGSDQSTNLFDFGQLDKRHDAMLFK